MNELITLHSSRLVVLLIVSAWIGALMTCCIGRRGHWLVLQNARWNAVLTALLATLLTAVDARSLATPGGAHTGAFPVARVVWARWVMEPATVGSPTSAGSPVLAGSPAWSVELALSAGVSPFNRWLLIWIPWLMCAVLWTLPREQQRAGPIAGLFCLEGFLLLMFGASDALTFCLAAEVSLGLMWWLTGCYGRAGRRTAATAGFQLQYAGQSLVTWGLMALAIAALWVQQDIVREAHTVRFDWAILADRLPKFTSRYIGSFEAWAPAAGYVTVALLTGLIIRVGLTPVHFWLPNWLEQAPGGIVLLQLGAAGLVGGYGYRCFLAPLVAADSTLAGVVMLLGAITCVVCGFLALAQTELRRFVCFWWLSSQGACWTGLASGVPTVQAGSWAGMTAVAAAATGLVLIILMIEQRYQTSSSLAVGGLSRRHPRLALAASLLVLTANGVLPLSSGLVTLWAGRWQFSQHTDYWWLTIGGTLLTSWGAIWCLQQVFFGELRLPATNSGAETTGNPAADVVNPAVGWPGLNAARPHVMDAGQVLEPDLTTAELLAVLVTAVIPQVLWLATFWRSPS